MKRLSLVAVSALLSVLIFGTVVFADEIYDDSELIENDSNTEEVTLVEENIEEAEVEIANQEEELSINEPVITPVELLDENYDVAFLDEPTPEISPEVTPETTPEVTPTPEITPETTPKVTPTPEITPETPPVVTPDVTPVVSPTPEAGNEETPVSSEEVLVRAFVERLYSKCLSRGSDTVGIDFWTNLLLEGDRTGADVALRFVFSEEYLSKKTSDEEFITMLYYAFFDRDPDSEGFNFWMNQLQTIHTREYIFSCFVNSAEFNTVCETYGIVRGTYSSPHPSDYSLDVAGFAQRLYTNAMDRKPDIEGIDYWTKQMTTFAQSPLEVAKYFFYSKEFVSKDLSDEDFIRVLYLTCMNREPEEEGRQYWLNKLSEDENGRNSAIAFFLTCGEFRTIMADSGVAESNIVTVAKTQLGESGGLKYCNWYGYKYRIEWCACFVSWCANQCGYIDNNIVPKYKWCLDAKDWFVQRNQWVSGSNYKPKSGDIIFFDWNHNGVIDHTGIVVGTEANGRIHTIEGNADDVVRNSRVIYVGDPDICGYGVPNYN